MRLPNEDDTARLLAIGESRGFSGILVPLIVCTRPGRIVLMHGKVCIGDIKRSLQLFLKLLLLKIFGFGMLSLGCQVRTMI